MDTEPILFIIYALGVVISAYFVGVHDNPDMQPTSIMLAIVWPLALLFFIPALIIFMAFRLGKDSKK